MLLGLASPRTYGRTLGAAMPRRAMPQVVSSAASSSSSSTSRRILLRVPTQHAPIPCLVETQSDLERVLSCEGFPRGVLVSEADECRVCRAAALQDGATYGVLPQLAEVRPLPGGLGRAGAAEVPTHLTSSAPGEQEVRQHVRLCALRADGSGWSKRYDRLDQAGLERVLGLNGAEGFLTEAGEVSTALALLAGGGTYTLAFPGEATREAPPAVREEVRACFAREARAPDPAAASGSRCLPALQPAVKPKGPTRQMAREALAAKEAELAVFLMDHAAEAYPGAITEVLPRALWKSGNGKVGRVGCRGSLPGASSTLAA